MSLITATAKSRACISGLLCLTSGTIFIVMMHFVRSANGPKYGVNFGLSKNHSEGPKGGRILTYRSEIFICDRG